MTEEAPIDWSLTTWEGVRREQLRRNLRLTLEERFRALDELATLSGHLANIGKASRALGAAQTEQPPPD